MSREQEQDVCARVQFTVSLTGTYFLNIDGGTGKAGTYSIRVLLG